MENQYRALDAKVLKAAIQKDYVTLETTFKDAVSARIVSLSREKYGS